MRLRAASIIPDNAKAKVASNSMLGNKVEPHVSKLFMSDTLIQEMHSRTADQSKDPSL
jgi:hypothetical protein